MSLINSSKTEIFCIIRISKISSDYHHIITEYAHSILCFKIIVISKKGDEAEFPLLMTNKFSNFIDWKKTESAWSQELISWWYNFPTSYTWIAKIFDFIHDPKQKAFWSFFHFFDRTLTLINHDKFLQMSKQFNKSIYFFSVYYISFLV